MLAGGGHPADAATAAEVDPSVPQIGNAVGRILAQPGCTPLGSAGHPCLTGCPSCRSVWTPATTTHHLWRENLGGGGVVAVGSDSRRDYLVLAEAARIGRIPITLVCQPRNLVGVPLPENVKVLHGVFDEAYRKLLHSADLVVTPTTAPAYPSGQSVVLEAMAMGRAALTTDSPAMRDYVRDGEDGALVPPRDARALADAIVGLVQDSRTRQRLGTSAQQAVRARFTSDHMWDAVAQLVRDPSA